jgi:hypothetical protein
MDAYRSIPHHIFIHRYFYSSFWDLSILFTELNPEQKYFGAALGKGRQAAKT